MEGMEEQFMTYQVHAYAEDKRSFFGTSEKSRENVVYSLTYMSSSKRDKNILSACSIKN
jgi:hypothetical protein